MKNEKTNETAAAEVLEPAAPDMEELVEFTAPLLGAEGHRDIFVAVNGESLRIKRGVPVMIRRKFLEAIENARQQAYEAWLQREKAAGAASTALAEF